MAEAFAFVSEASLPSLVSAKRQEREPDKPNLSFYLETLTRCLDQRLARNRQGSELDPDPTIYSVKTSTMIN